MKPALVLALNPSIDAEWRVDDLRPEEKNTVESERRWAGGKGVNVARWLKHLATPCRLLLPLGGNTGAELAGYLRAERVGCDVVKILEPTRVNVVVTTEVGGQMRFNPRGPQLSNAEWRRIFERAAKIRMKDGIQILTGALPRNARAEVYARLVEQGHKSRVKTLLDCDGPALAAALRAEPYLVKPNRHELQTWAGRPLKTESALLKAARKMSGLARNWVLVSGGAAGAFLVHEAEGHAFKAMPPTAPVRNTVGAGDALLAAVTWRMTSGDEPAGWLRWGVAVGTAATRHAAGSLPTHAAIRSVWRQVRVVTLGR